jgi:hypothetical protein
MKALRLVFFLLVLANIFLFAWNQGHFGSDDEGREPQRLNEQKAADKLHIVPDHAPTAPVTDAAKPTTAEVAQAVPALPPAATAPAAGAPSTPTASATTAATTAAATDKAPDKPTAQIADKPVASCRLLTGFKLGEARQWVAANSAKLADSKFAVSPVGAASSFDVMIPALAGRDAADTKQKEIRALGITLPLRTIADGPEKLALVFTTVNTETEAKDYLQALQDKGVRSARVVPRLAPTAPAQIEVRNLDAARTKTLKDLLAARSDIHGADCPNR